MLSKIKSLKEFEKVEIIVILLAWLYLFVSIITVIVASIAYMALMLEYLKFQNESFPGMSVLLCAFIISFAILVIWFAADLLNGIKMKNAEDVSNFRKFTIISFILSFIILTCNVFDSVSINEWLISRRIFFLKIPNFKISIMIFIYHAIILIIVDALYGNYKNKTISTKNITIDNDKEEEEILEIT